jgi:hypothetical protein
MVSLVEALYENQLIILNVEKYMSEDVFFFGLLPLTIISGVLAYATSYKAILYKLIPFLLTIVFLSLYEYFPGLFSRPNNSTTGTGIILSILIGSTFLFTVGLVITTSIARFIKRKRTTASVVQ